MSEASEKSGARNQVLTGTVVSNKMDKTVVVSVQRTIMHRLYRRYMKRTKSYAAHDEGNQCGVGDLVTIVSSRPRSRTKRWQVREIVRRAEVS